MIRVPIYQVDAFATEVFEGNPAAVCPLASWFPDTLLRAIADENNLSETAFVVKENEGYRIRWFTPEAEVDLCGHATLAAAHVLFEHLHVTGNAVEFQSRSGLLTVAKEGRFLVMNFPAAVLTKVTAPPALRMGLPGNPVVVYKDFDYLAVYESATEVRSLTPNFLALAELDGRGVVVTAPADDAASARGADFISRCFYPKLRVNEDPVTGSAHCMLAPYWAKRLAQP